MFSLCIPFAAFCSSFVLVYTGITLCWSESGCVIVLRLFGEGREVRSRFDPFDILSLCR